MRVGVYQREAEAGAGAKNGAAPAVPRARAMSVPLRPSNQAMEESAMETIAMPPASGWAGARSAARGQGVWSGETVWNADEIEAPTPSSACAVMVSERLPPPSRVGS